MNFASIVLLIIILALSLAAMNHLQSKGAGCSGNCSGCAASSCPSHHSRRGTEKEEQHENS